MEKDKIESLLGFAVKAGKLVYGADSLETTRTRVYAVFTCSTASENTRQKVRKLTSAKRIPMVITKNELQYIVSRKNCKVIGVTDRQMAEAMLARVNESYYIDCSEVK